MPELDEALRMPRPWAQRGRAWKEMTTGDTLFQALHEGVRNHRTGSWVERLGTWSEYIRDNDNQVQRQWNIARSLAWCAEQATTYPDFYRTEIDRVCFALTQTPEFIIDEVWAWVCIRTFLDVPSRRVEVAAVSWDERAGEGDIVTLILEVLQGGAGQIAPHPCDAFTYYPGDLDNDFASSMYNAWQAARALISSQSDGRWRVLRAGQPMQWARGHSAGGAAALGWYRALTGALYDERVIVLAQIDGRGKLSGVDGVAAKVRAIVNDGRFDTIVVASPRNKDEAESTLRELGKSGVIRVGDLR